VRRALIPRLLPRSQVGAGLALFNMSFQAAMLAGPVAAGAVTAWAGLIACFVINTVMLLAAFYGIVGLPQMTPESVHSDSG
jgi:predicted MFS family arabinose efflux permease